MELLLDIQLEYIGLVQHKDISAILLATRKLLAPPRDAEAIRGPAHTALALLELARSHAQQATS